MNTKIKFDRVDLSREIDIKTSGGMSFCRDCFTHEILLSFYDDDGRFAFEKWWEIEGKYNFGNFCDNNDSFKWLIEDEK